MMVEMWFPKPYAVFCVVTMEKVQINISYKPYVKQMSDLHMIPFCSEVPWSYNFIVTCGDQLCIQSHVT